MRRSRFRYWTEAEPEKPQLSTNRATRRLTTVVSQDAEGLRSKFSELGGWFPAAKADAVKEVQLPKEVQATPGLRSPAVMRRVPGRRTEAAVTRRVDVTTN